MSMRALWLGLLLALAACGGGGSSSVPSPAPAPTPTPTPTVTIPNVAAFLAQNICQDGNGNATATLPTDPSCNPRPLTAADPLYWRRHDLPAVGGQIEDTFANGASWITTWVYAPWTSFASNPANDGGEVYTTDGTTVTIAATQDGGKPGMQYFVGPACGGTGWVLFKNDAPTGSWNGVLGSLANASSPTACPALQTGYVQYRLETLTLPFVIGGVAQNVSVNAVISEAYAGPSIAAATAMERFVLGQGWGRLIWGSWRTTPPTDPTLPQRCPFSTAFTGPASAPAAGWYLNDCRDVIDIEPADGSMSGAAYGWPL